MARQAAAVEVNAFIKGLVTEASPLTFPDNASIDEVNMVLNKDGSRNRRLGMNYEPNYTTFDSGEAPSDDLVFTSFNWKSPGGFTDKEFLAIQTGARLTILDSTMLPVSSQTVATYDIGASSTQRMSMASVDGLLIVVTGDGTIYNVDYNGAGFTLGSGRLKIRDLFGVEDSISGTDLLEGSGLTVRPATTTPAHTYNLRNQTFAYPRFIMGDEVLRDPLPYFKTTYGVYQSNSDNLVTYLYANANDSDDRETRRYIAKDNFMNPLGSFRAPRGFFIIDALNRGASRALEVEKLHQGYPALTLTVGTLPADRTPDGASVVASFAGRMWYAGFSSQLVGGDSQSPRMTSYVLFSKLVQSTADIYKCYQEGDPTSAEAPDLVDTDGGFLRIDGAYNIQHMINVGDSIMVVAENGVWRISGGSGYGFAATNYMVSKISEHGCVAPGSVTVLDNTFMYWGDDAIYHVATNQYGDWVGTNLSSSTIQTYYDEIPYLSKTRCQGMYDAYQRCVRWLFNNYISSTGKSTELVLDINLNAFYPSEVSTLSAGSYPKVMSLVRVPPFTVMSSISNVIDESSNNVVTSSINNVTVVGDVATSATSEVFYLTATGLVGGTVRCTFSYYRDETWHDWKASDGGGVDAAAYLVTGWSGLGDFQRFKQVPYITVYSYKTETGFNASYIPQGASSILVQSQWNWTNSAVAGKWGQQFQAYRHRRHWIPATNASEFDDGELVVTSRSKLRGRGRVLSLRFDTESGYDFHLLGWSFVAVVNSSV